VTGVQTCALPICVHVFVCLFVYVCPCIHSEIYEALIVIGTLSLTDEGLRVVVDKVTGQV
jgi:hypothetical protein